MSHALPASCELVLSTIVALRFTFNRLATYTDILYVYKIAIYRHHQYHIMSTTDTPTSTDIMDTCANCGKEGSEINICNKCKAATYCNAACKKKHRKKHKKKCEIRVAELHDEAYSRYLCRLKIVQFASFVCHPWKVGVNISRVVERHIAVDVAMHPFMILGVIL